MNFVRERHYAFAFKLFILTSLALIVLIIVVTLQSLNKDLNENEAVQAYEEPQLMVQHEPNSMANDFEKPIERAKRLYMNPKYIKLVKKYNKTADTKSIVDRPTKRPLEDVLEALALADEDDQEHAKHFVAEYLNEPGSDLIQVMLHDWTPNPSIIDKLQSHELKLFTSELNKIWLDLARTYDHSIHAKGFVSSHLMLKNPFIVPGKSHEFYVATRLNKCSIQYRTETKDCPEEMGQRFIEQYYWDTFWIMEGLLVCDMYETVRLMLENFIHLIQDFGFIPNGSRIYYLNRSQPPYFPHMIETYSNYIEMTNILSEEAKEKERKFILYEALPYMVKEYEFWMTQRTIEIEKNGRTHELNLYNVDTSHPRPESYFEDLKNAEEMNQVDRERLFKDKASAAESGYDFSSRWQEDPVDLRTIRTSKIVPVDLNAIMFKSEMIISRFYRKIDNQKISLKYENKAKQRELAMNELLWSNDHVYWCDLDIDTQCLNTRNFYISNLSPLWMDIRPPNGTINEVIDKNKSLLNRCKFGIPVSFVESGEQWDFPNLWAPNQHSLIFMLLKHDSEFSLKLAKDFFTSVYHGWKKTGLIFEKYNACEKGERGEGGEYEIQTGFGWTNGVILTLLDTFGDKLLD